MPATAKPEPLKRLRRRQKAARGSNTSAVYAAVVERDGWKCRIPGCPSQVYELEMAHLENKGMGGDHGLRTTPELCCMLCRDHHQGSYSLHSGHLTYEFLTEALANGPIRFSIVSKPPTERYYDA